MRSILNVSVPIDIAEQIRQTVKKRNFKSISEYFVYSILLEQSLISEDEVLVRANEVQEAYDKGNIYS